MWHALSVNNFNEHVINQYVGLQKFSWMQVHCPSENSIKSNLKCYTFCKFSYEIHKIVKNYYMCMENNKMSVTFFVKSIDLIIEYDVTYSNFF